MLKFSIITPSYNQGEYIEDTIRSVLDQNYSNFEHIIFDNKSIDNTLDILNKYNHLIWKSEKDKGQTNAINKGLKKASGDILCYLNSDDALAPGALNFVAGYFENNNGVDLIYGNCILIDIKGKIIKIRKPEEFNLNRLLYLGYSYIQQPSTFFRKSVIDDIGYFDESLKYVMDYDYWIRAARGGKVLKYVDRNLSLMRIHKKAKTFASNKEMFLEAFSVSKRNGGNKLVRYYLHYLFWYILNSFPGLFKFLFNIRNKGKIK
ncbi:MAG: glycosyltransferase [Chloroflexi bacterium]|nr:glycosyltransferase [Chloroflexota bacterium]